MATPLTTQNGLVPLNVPWKVSVMVYFDTLADTILYRWLPAVAVALIFAAIWWAVPQLIYRLIRAARVRSHTAELAASIARLLIFIFGVYRVLRLLGFDPNYILATFGITSLALSWAMSPVIRNYWAGMVIKWQDVAEENFCIEVIGVQGIVEKCDVLYFTLLNASTDSIEYIPNSIILDNPIRNLSHEECVAVAGPRRAFRRRNMRGKVMLYTPQPSYANIEEQAKPKYREDTVNRKNNSIFIE